MRSDADILKHAFMAWALVVGVSAVFGFGFDAMLSTFMAPAEIAIAAVTASVGILGVFAIPALLGILAVCVVGLLYPIYDIQRDHPRNTFDRDVPFREVRKARRTTAECINCGAEFEGGYVIRFGRETIVAGVVAGKEVEGRHYECAPCYEDPLEASLRIIRDDPNIPAVDRNDHDLDGLVICRMCETPNVESRTHCGECDHPLPVEASDGG